MTASTPYRVIEPPRWRTIEEGKVELWDPGEERWHRLAAWTATLLEGATAEEDLDTLTRRIDPNDPPRPRRALRVRRFLYNLTYLGYLEIPLDLPDAFADRYERVRELGRGGVGVAHLARDRRGEHPGPLVVKHAWDFFLSHDVTEAAVRREGDVLSRLDHPGVVRLHDRVELDGRIHLVREFVDGHGFDSYRWRPLEDRRHARRLLADAAEILAHLHDRGLLLVDGSPDNFMLDAADRVRLTDVGQCVDAPHGEARLRSVSGTPGFVPPEATSGGSATIRGDVWMLGRLYAFLVTGVNPPKDPSLEAVLGQVPDAADRRLVARLSADDPENRPADMRSAADILRGNG